MSHSQALPPYLTLVIACYNELPIFDTSIAETFAVLDGLGLATEIVFVDDASRDGTADAIRRIAARHAERQIVVIQHDRNTGRGAAVRDGIRAARGTLVGFIDIDLEVHARYIPQCLQALERVMTSQRSGGCTTLAGARWIDIS